MFHAEFSVSAIFYVFILSIILVLSYWYHWLYEGPYKNFPASPLEVEGILKIVLKKRLDSNAIFQMILRSGKKFQKEGVCVVRFLRHYVLIYGEDFTKVLSNEKAVLDKASIYNLIKEALGNGLLGSNGDIWKFHRKILNPGISTSFVISNIPLFNRKAHQLVNELQRIEGVPTEQVDEMLMRCSFGILAESVFGFNADDEIMGAKVKKFMKAYDRGKEIFLERIPRPWLYFKRLLPWFKIGREYIECIDYIQSFTREVILEMKTSLILSKEQSDEERNAKKSITQILLEEHLMKGSLTVEDFEDHVRTFMMAGYDTIYSALLWCLYELGHHPELQEKLCDEIQSVIKGKDVSYEELCRLKYTDRVLKETLRLYPSAPIYGRKLSEDVHCGKYTVPKGSEVLFFPYLLHRNPDIYPDPYKFDPDRFLDNSEIRPWMHVAFAEGYRNCIGKKYALLELKVLLAQVIRAYKVTSLCRVEESEMDWRIILKCTKKIRLLLTNRNSTNVASE